MNDCWCRLGLTYGSGSDLNHLKHSSGSERLHGQLLSSKGTATAWRCASCAAMPWFSPVHATVLQRSAAPPWVVLPHANGSLCSLPPRA